MVLPLQSPFLLPCHVWAAAHLIEAWHILHQCLLVLLCTTTSPNVHHSHHLVLMQMQLLKSANRTIPAKHLLNFLLLVLVLPCFLKFLLDIEHRCLVEPYNEPVEGEQHVDAEGHQFGIFVLEALVELVAVLPFVLHACLLLCHHGADVLHLECIAVRIAVAECSNDDTLLPAK